jgi:hypothetical protein
MGGGGEMLPGQGGCGDMLLARELNRGEQKDAEEEATMEVSEMINASRGRRLE